MLVKPNAYILAEAQRLVQKQLNIACEIYIVEQYARIHYADLMGDVPDGFASKDRLVNWLNDYTRNGRIVREGAISKYKKDFKDNFENGIWQASNFCVFISYLKDLLTDESFVKNRKTAETFKRSFADREWFQNAIAVSGLKLLENLYEQNALQTNIAKAYIRQVFLARELLNSVAKIIGRSTKNHDAFDMKELLGDIVEQNFKAQLRSAFDIFRNEAEYRVYKKYASDIQRALETVFATPIGGKAEVKKISAKM